ncbi:hypothetical protein [Novosphingobium sp.]|uniref:hypothetical protein n=1 Tax=Novosphingobium sp. TaxID=1874826 RepID=UPI00286C5F65|nr:hypothetical protein [Novosphingobium sp.]
MPERDPPRPLPTSPRFTGLRGLALIAVAVPAMFWLGFGRIDGFALAFTAFLVMLAAGVKYLPALTARIEQEQAGHTAPSISQFDALGVVWLLSIPFAPFFTWILRNMAPLDASDWTTVLGISAFCCVVVPIVCVLPMLRFERRGTAHLALPILAIGTAFPVATGAGSAYDIVRGPVWQSVTVVRLVNIDRLTSKGTRVRAEAVFVDLADGRQLSRAENVKLHEGPARVKVLRGTRRIIGAVQQQD